MTPANGVTPPFPGQPIPGFSAVLPAGHGEFWGMPDNGYGAKTNPGDFLLRLYKVRPSFRTARGGSGTIGVRGFLQLPEFGFPLQSVESLAYLGGESLLIANDNNYPGSNGRWIARNRPDDTEMIVVRVPRLHRRFR